jgi:hypothetical protein
MVYLLCQLDYYYSLVNISYSEEVILMGNEYEDHWIPTYTGIKFHYLNPKPEEISITDIAHHLCLLCRFTGACKRFYSVADHSIRVSMIVEPELRLAALLHDAAEAYTNDISRPVKYTHKLQETEAIITKAIDKKFGIDSNHPSIKEADNILIATEARDLMPNIDGWEELPMPLSTKIIPMTPLWAERLFMIKFEEYINA